jgi:Tfp pilus assembly protein PilF
VGLGVSEENDGAEALVSGTPDTAGLAIDLAMEEARNDPSLRARALIAASAKQPQRADDWFSRAVKAAPSVPFAYTEWGQDLLERGQLDAAIEKFRQANEKLEG